jgi:post-segregation antitoxin (ccd killing protein)
MEKSKKKTKMVNTCVYLPSDYPERAHKCGINMSGLLRHILEEKFKRYERPGQMDRKEVMKDSFGGNVPW